MAAAYNRPVTRSMSAAQCCTLPSTLQDDVHCVAQRTKALHRSSNALQSSHQDLKQAVHTANAEVRAEFDTTKSALVCICHNVRDLRRMTKSLRLEIQDLRTHVDAQTGATTREEPQATASGAVHTRLKLRVCRKLASP